MVRGMMVKSSNIMYQAYQTQSNIVPSAFCNRFQVYAVRTRYVVLPSSSLIHYFAEIHGPFSSGSPLPRVDERRRSARSAKGKSARGDLRSAAALLLGRTPTPGRGRALAAAVGAIGEKRTVGEGWDWEGGGGVCFVHRPAD